MNDSGAPEGATPSTRIDARIAELDDWRGAALARVRALIHEAEPEVIEDWKWRGVPVWYRDGMICTGETFKKAVKLTFAKGAALEDPAGLFNASLEGNQRRAIDIHEGEEIDGEALKGLIRAAVALNRSKGRSRGAGGIAGKKTKASDEGAPGAVKLLSGGNPQIPKGYGDAPVQAYIAAMPGWKSAVGRQLDALVVGAVPEVRKAVKWNSPFYGIEGEGWFLSFHCFTRYVKVTFLNGAKLTPLPPGASKHPGVRYLDIHEDRPLDAAQFTDWVVQASRLPGERL